MLTSPFVLRIAALFMTCATLLQPIVALITRLAIGWMFHGTGHAKLQNFSATVDRFTGWGIPLPTANAAFIASLEFVGGLCLMIGLGTRLFSFLLACTMIVAIMTADWNDFIGAFHGGEKPLLDVTPVAPLIFLMWLIAFGPGVLSLDRLLFSKFGKKPAVN